MREGFSACASRLDGDGAELQAPVMSLEILQRPRRNRRSDSIRRLVRETVLRPEDLIWPLFVHAEKEDLQIESMPGVSRLSLDSLLQACERALELGIPAVAIFPSIPPGLKNDSGSHAFDETNLLYRSVSEVKKRFPNLVVITDVALDPYTDHGHDGLLSADGCSVENDSTVEALCRLAVLEAQSGADIVAPRI
jgi:porphobilinogen synthase